MKIETVPLPEVAGVRVELRFKGDMEEFESINKELEILKKTAAFDTVPLTGNEFIGTWPTPEKLKKHIYWTIGVTTKARKTKS